MIRESEKHGVKALVLTVDAPVFRRKGVVNQFPDYMKFVYIYIYIHIDFKVSMLMIICE